MIRTYKDVPSKEWRTLPLPSRDFGSIPVPVEHCYRGQSAMISNIKNRFAAKSTPGRSATTKQKQRIAYQASVSHQAPLLSGLHWYIVDRTCSIFPDQSRSISSIFLKRKDRTRRLLFCLLRRNNLSRLCPIDTICKLLVYLPSGSSQCWVWGLSLYGGLSPWRTCC